MASPTLGKNLRRVVKHIFVICLTIVLLILLVPLLSIFIIPLLFHRWLISKLAMCFKSHELRKMATTRGALLGTMNLYNEHAFTSVVTMEVSDPNIDVENIRHLIQVNALDAINPKTGLPMYPELTQSFKIWMGYLFFAKVDHFDLKEHAYYLPDAANITAQWTKEEDVGKLLRQLARYKKWVKGKPLWEFIVIPNVSRKLVRLDETNDSNCSLIVFRMHHAIGDGLSILKLLTRISGDFNAMVKVAKPNFMKKERSGVASFFHNIGFLLKAPFEFVDYALADILHNVNIPELGDANNKQIYLTGAMSKDIPLQSLKDIKNLHNVEFNSLIFAMITGGVRHMLLKHRGASKLPKNVSIGFPLPMPAHPNKLRNHMSVGRILLPVGETDPGKRIQILYRRILRLKTSTLPWSMSMIIRLIGALPAPLAKLRKGRRIPPLLLTNLPGPAGVMMAMDSPVLGIRIGSNAPIDGPQGYAFMFMTYNGNARLTAGGQNTFLPTPEDSEELLQHSLDQLKFLSHSGTV